MRALLLLLLVVGCTNDNDLTRVDDHYGIGESSISGRVCDETRNVWLEGASVYTHIIDTSGELRDTRKVTTDDDGRWALEDMAGGTYTVYVQYGSTTLDMFDVTLEEGETFEMDEPSCSGARDLEVAVVTGDFDDFEQVLEAVGIGGFHAVDGQTGAELVQFLTAPDQLAAYDAIFFAGGHIEEGIFYSTDGADQATVDTVIATLQAYVEEGGVVIASDWSYDVVERAWPRRIEFYGDDERPDAAQVGVPTVIDTTVADSDLADVLGRERLRIQFDLDTWPVAESVDEGVRTLLSGTAPWQVGTEAGTSAEAPILVSFESGDGHVVFTPWRMMTNLDGTALEVVQWVVDEHL